MNSAEYRRIYGQLSSRDDIKRLSREEGLDEELLIVILSQKIVRNTKRTYYEIKNKAPSLLGHWMHGKKFTDIASKEGFSPVLTASLMLQHTGVSKKQFKNYLNNPETIPDKRLKQEILDAMKEELIYSPEGTRMQWGRGKDVELTVKKWLDLRRVSYVTEYDAKKGEYTKTPDFRLEAPIKVQDKWVNWVECKASFGDESEYKRDYGKQLSHYVNLFGQGMVCYWYGYVEDMPQYLRDEKVIVVDRRFYEAE
ncbi:MAG: C15orf41 family protein [Candidatus Altiarchaeota archaeon]